MDPVTFPMEAEADAGAAVTLSAAPSKALDVPAVETMAAAETEVATKVVTMEATTTTGAVVSAAASQKGRSRDQQQQQRGLFVFCFDGFFKVPIV